jgi:hypothetical protein
LAHLPSKAAAMTLITTTLGLSLPMLLVFFGVLIVSLATAMLALLADY